MPARSITYPLSILIAVLLILSLLASIWAAPTVGTTLGLIFLLFGITATSYTIIRKYRKAYLQDEIPFSISIRNICLEIAAILFAIFLAALVGRYLGGLINGNMNSTPARLIIGIGVGLLAGWVVGLFIRHASSRFVRTSSGS
jgi:hypothetical protein